MMMCLESITIIKSPYHVGIKNHRVGQGPQALLDAGLSEQIRACTNLPIEIVEIDDVVEELTEIEGDIGRSFAVLRNVSKAVRQAVENHSWPLVLSGNCMGVVGVHAGCGDSGRELFWFDAHADLETPETTTSGYLDGQGACMLLGKGFGALLTSLQGWTKIDGRQLIGVAWRAVSDSEEQGISQNGIRVVRGGKLINNGEYVTELNEILSESTDFKNAILHVDVDSLDVSVGIANEFSVGGGLGKNDLIDCVGLIGRRRNIKAMHVASFHPEYEEKEEVAKATIAAVVEVVKTVVSRTDE